MRIKNSNLVWYVLNYDFNNKQVVNYNVMSGVVEALHKKVKSKEVYDKATLKTFLTRYFQYYYWGKSECEILVADVGEHDINKAEKIDIWRQLEMNLDRIVDYVNIQCKLNY